MGQAKVTSRVKQEQGGVAVASAASQPSTLTTHQLSRTTQWRRWKTNKQNNEKCMFASTVDNLHQVE